MELDRKEVERILDGFKVYVVAATIATARLKLTGAEADRSVEKYDATLTRALHDATEAVLALNNR